MVKKKRFHFIFLLVPFFCVCSSNIPDTHYYLIDYPIEPKSNKSEPVHKTILGVERFKANPLYKDERLVYRESQYEGKYYNYHRWITNPEELITNKVIEQLNASNLFEQVVAFPKYSHVDYVLHGIIKALEEWDEDDQWYAIVNIAFKLVDRKTNQIVWQNSIEKKNKVSKKNPPEVVKEINMGVKQCIEELQIILKSIH